MVLWIDSPLSIVKLSNTIVCQITTTLKKYVYAVILQCVFPSNSIVFPKVRKSTTFSSGLLLKKFVLTICLIFAF